MSKFKWKITGEDLLRHLILAWLTAVTAEYLRLPPQLRDLAQLGGLEHMSLTRVVCVTAVLLILLIAVDHYIPLQKAERWAMTVVFAALAWASMPASFSWAYFTACILIVVALVVFDIYGWQKSSVLRRDRIYQWMTILFSLIFFLFLSLWTVSKAESYCTATYDFGIFSQMFYYMKETGRPLTTLERDGLLSHFYVHVSPIYYLMLPFYLLSPKPATLQILQAAVMTSAVIPLWKIGTKHNLQDWQKMLLCAVLLLVPAFAGGAAYDLHENCFLTPLILWIFWAIDVKNTKVLAISAVLTLFVKEDAAVYVAVIALWLLVRSLLDHKPLRSWDTAAGGAMFLGSVGWFFLVTAFLTNVGDGVMSYRYQNFMYDDSGSLITVIRAVLMNPMKAVYECVDREKLSYIALTVLPLVGLPLMTRRYERYLLLIPYLLVNLMSDYTYQHSLFFQYNFGSLACMIYLTAVNLADLRGEWKKVAALSVAVVLSAGCFIQQIVPRAKPFPDWWKANLEEIQQIDAALEEIPEDASVTASTYYTTKLSQRKILYDIEYCSRAHLLESEYVVLADGCTCSTYAPDGVDGRENVLALLQQEGYTVYREIPGELVIYRR